MSTHKHIPRYITKRAFALIDNMPPLKSKKDPTIAAVAGFALGGIGLALYFGTLVDFLVPVFIWIVMMVVALPTGETLLITAPVFCAIFGYRRAKSSNARLSGASREILTAEVVVEPLQTRSVRKI